MQNVESSCFHFPSTVAVDVKSAFVVQAVHSAVTRSVQPNPCPWDFEGVGVVVVTVI